MSEQETMYVVLDANVFIADYRLASPNFRILFEKLDDAGLHLAIPIVALEETVYHFGNRLRDEHKEIEKLLGSLRYLTNRTIPAQLGKTKLERIIANYPQFLRQKIEEQFTFEQSMILMADILK